MDIGARAGRSTDSATSGDDARALTAAERWSAIAMVAGFFGLLWWGPYTRTVGLHPAVLIPVMLLAALPVLRRALSSLELWRHAPPALCAYSAWAVLSLVWSPDRLLGLYWLGSELLTVGLVWAAVVMLPTRTSLRAIQTAFVVVLVTTIAWLLVQEGSRAIAVVDGISYGLGWRGGFVHKNVLGMLCVAGCLVALHGARSRWAQLVAVLAWVGLLVGSRSATAVIGLAAGLAAWVIVSANHRPRTRTRAGVGRRLLVVGAGMATAGAAGMAVAAWLGKDRTLSNRFDIWPVVLDRIGDHPIIGWGAGTWAAPFQAFTKAMNLDIGHEAHHAHNGVLDVTMRLGAIGLVLMLWLLASVARRAVLALRHESTWALGRLGVAVFTAVVVMSITEPTFRFGPLGLLAVLWVILDRELRSPVPVAPDRWGVPAPP